MSEKVESVEALAEIELLEQGKADAAAGRLTSHDDVKAELEAADALQLARTEDWTVACAMDVASYFIDGVPSPHTRQEVTVIIARHADDELLRMREKQPATPPEPVVMSEDVTLARKIWMLDGAEGDIAIVLARARQAEREELLKAQLTGVSQMNEIRSLKQSFGEVCDARDALQAKLTASEARVRELEQQLQLHAIDAGRVANEAAEVYRRANNVLHNYKIPATADAEGGS